VARPGDVELMRMPRHRSGEAELMLPPWYRPGGDELMLPPWYRPGGDELMLPPWPGPVMLSICCPPRHRPGEVEQELPPWPGPAMLRWNRVVWGSFYATGPGLVLLSCIYMDLGLRARSIDLVQRSFRTFWEGMRCARVSFATHTEKG
jgi:hypothetical protein